MQPCKGSLYLGTHPCIVCTDFMFYQELQNLVHALSSILNWNLQQLEKKITKKKSLISKRPEVSAYLTCPPFNSHSLCTLDTSVVLHTGITKKASKSLPTVKQTNANSLFLMEVSSLLKFADFFPTSLTKTTKSVKRAFVTERLSIQKVFCKLV